MAAERTMVRLAIESTVIDRAKRAARTEEFRAALDAAVGENGENLDEVVAHLLAAGCCPMEEEEVGYRVRPVSLGALAMLDAAAAKTGVSRSSLIRGCLVVLGRPEGKPKPEKAKPKKAKKPKKPRRDPNNLAGDRWIDPNL
jgi:hypothetical protein